MRSIVLISISTDFNIFHIISMLNNIMNKYEIDPSYVQPERGVSPLHYACGMPNGEVGERVVRRFMERACMYFINFEH